MSFASLFNRSKRNLRTSRRRHAPFVTEALEERVLLSHYRYGNLSWEPAAGAAANTIQFHYEQGWRLSAFGGAAAVGDVVSEFDSLNYGDGTFDTITLKILSINAAEDNFVAEAGTGTGASFTPGFVHTYGAPGDYTASFESCCRISTLLNNADGEERNETTVNVGTGNSSPVSSLPPIVQVADNSIVQFQIPGVDPNGDPITFRLATAAEAAGFSFYDQPSGLSISSTGLVTWDIRDSVLSTDPGDLWTSQVILEDRDALGAVKSKIPIDFILQVAESTSVNQPPIIAASPTGPFSPIAGSPLNFTVTATDPDSGDTINSLFATNPPTGMTFSGFAPGGNSASLNVSFTPTAAQANQTFVVTFQTTDNRGATATTSVVISPSAPPTNQAPVAVDDSATTNAGTAIGIAAATLLANDSDPDGDAITLTAVSAASAQGGTVSFDSATSTVTYTPPAGFLGADTFTYTIKDGAGLTATATVTVDVRPFGFNALGDTSKAKQSGSTVPIKIQATDFNGANVSSSSLVVKAVGFAPTSSPNSIRPVEGSGKANPGGLFRFDSGSYMFNWQLVDPATGSGLPVGEYLFYFTIGDDPTLHSVTVGVKIGKK